MGRILVALIATSAIVAEPRVSGRTISQTGSLESAVEAAEQLAIYYEHREKEPQNALELVRAAIADVHAARREGKIAKTDAEKMKARLRPRLDRLEKRCLALPLL